MIQRWWLHLGTLVLVLCIQFFIVPGVVEAQGLVPACQAGDASCDNAYAPQNYGTCEIVLLANNVLRFIIGLLSLIATLVFVYAGYLLVLSRGDVSQMERAKGMFTNVLIGLVIMLSAFLIVNTVMSILVGSDSSLLNWSNIECSYQNESGVAERRMIRVGSNENTIEFSDAEYQQYVSTVSPSLLTASAGACNSTITQQVWGSLASQASCIAAAESSCGASPISRTDIGADRNPFSFGAMQINTTVHSIQGCGHLNIGTLNCADAWSGRNYSARVVNPQLYAACRAALLDTRCSMINAQRIYREAGNSWRPWSTASRCNLR